MRQLAILLGVMALSGPAAAADKRHRAEPPHVYIRIVKTDRPRLPIPNARPRVINPGQRRNIWGTPHPENAPENILPQPDVRPIP